MNKKIWDNSFCSQVIATSICIIFTPVLTSIYPLINSFFNHKSFMDNWIEVLKEPLTWIIVVILLAITLYLLFRKKKFKYDEVSLKQDQLLLNQIITKDLPESFFNDYFRNCDLGSSYLQEHLEPLMDFESFRHNPQYEFNNPLLENIKNELLSDISSFKDHIALNTIANGNGIVKVLDAIREDDKRFVTYKNKAHKLADNICINYDNLIRTMRSQRIGS